MNLLEVLLFGALALLIGRVGGHSGAPALARRWRGGLILASSLLAIYSLQPSTPVRALDFWLPGAALLLAALTWAVLQPRGPLSGQDRLAAVLILGVALAVALTRYAGALCCLTPTRPPELLRVLPLLVMLAGLLWLAPRFIPGGRGYGVLLAALIAGLIALLVVQKSPALAVQSSALLRTLNGQPADQASALDLPWLGFSYLAFRLIHVLRDAQLARAGGRAFAAPGLGEFFTYAFFFPTYIAGPIERWPRFAKQLVGNASAPSRAEEDLTVGGWRILLGAFKKFVLADSLALIALNGQNAAQASGGWLWVLLYAYALRIYWDFSGYTDIAIGMGRLLGITLPENFNRPYLKTNLAAFWNSWHITLAQWFQAYFFHPFNRALRQIGRAEAGRTPSGHRDGERQGGERQGGGRQDIGQQHVARSGQELPAGASPRESRQVTGRAGEAGNVSGSVPAAPHRGLPEWAMLLAAQLSTMLLIGLWHGITPTFAAWGAWHGLGLFVQNRWSGWLRARLPDLDARPRLSGLLRLGGWALTFHYVTLGWVFFALPSMSLALSVLRRLLGLD